MSRRRQKKNAARLCADLWRSVKRQRDRGEISRELYLQHRFVARGLWRQAAYRPRMIYCRYIGGVR